MANETTSTLDGFFKEVYGDLSNVVPEFSILREDLGFQNAERLGDSYHFPVRVRRGYGATYGTAGTAYTLNTPTAGVMKDANVSGASFVARVQPAYDVISRARTSKEAFGSSFDEIVNDLMAQASFHLEMNLLYGQTNIGVLDVTYAGGGATTATMVISAATWAAGLWSQMEGAPIDIYSAAGGTKRNTVGDITVGVITPSTRTVAISGAAADLAAIVDNDVVIPKGADTLWFAGLDKILSNTGSLFGIDAGTYSLWKASTASNSSAAATMATFTKAQAETVVRGGMGPMTFYVSTYTWTDVMNDLSALRRFNEDTKREMSLGTNKISFTGPGGTMDIVAHPMVKAGEAFGIQKEHVKRIGSSDITFNLGIPGQDDRFFRELADNAGFELRNYWDQAMIITAPARCVKVTGIVNNSLS